MTYKDLLKLYGSDIKIAANIGFSITAVKSWTGKSIPRISQLAIQTITKNKLKADEVI